MSGQAGRFYSFDSFTLDAARRTLLRDGEPVPLKPKTFETLLALVQNRGRVVGKDELMRELWPDTVVEEANLTQHVSLARKALGDDPKGPRFIVTVPGRGYSFVADVREADAESDAAGEPRPTVETGRRPEGEGASPAPRPAAPPPRPGRTRRWAPFAALAAVVASAFALGYYWSGRQGASADAPVGSIAVLPFKSAGGGGEDDYLRLGLTDSLIARFNGLRRVAVRQMGEVLKYDKPGQDPVEAGRALKVDAVLDGVIEKQGDRVRLTARLLDSRTGRTLWAQTFDERWTDIFVLQDTLTLRVSESLSWDLSHGERRRLAKHHTSNPAAYEFYLKGDHLRMKRTAESLAKSIQYLEKAIELDPRFVPAYTALAQNYIEPPPPLTPKEAHQKRKELFLKALEIDSTHGQAYSGLAVYAWRVERDWGEAERLMRRAAELEPNNPSVRNNYGVFLLSAGRVDEGLAELRQAESLSPANVGIITVLGTAYIYARRYDEAIEQDRKALELEPDYALALMGIGWAHGHKGMYPEAFDWLERAARLEERRGSNMLALLGHFYALAGRRDDALKTLERLDGLQAQGRGSWGARAVVHAALGDRDRAFDCLDKALENSEWWVSTLKVNPVFDPLRADPRFAGLMRRTGLTP